MEINQRKASTPSGVSKSQNPPSPPTSSQDDPLRDIPRKRRTPQVANPADRPHRHLQLSGGKQPSTSNQDNELPASWPFRHVPRKRRTALISPCGPSNVLPVPSFQQDSRNPSLGHSQLGGERQPSTSNEDNDLPAAWLFRLVPKKHRTPLISPRGPSNVLPTPPFQRDSLGGRQPWATNRVDHPVGADFRACTSHPKTSRSLGSDGVQLSGDKTIVKLAFSTENYQHGILEVQGYDAEQSYYTFYPKLTDSGEKRGPFKLKASIRRSQGTPGRHQATSASEASSLGPGE